MRRTFYVTALAGAYVAGRRVELMEPGPSGAVELDLTDLEAAAELRIGSLSETPPEPPPEGETTGRRRPVPK